MILVSSVQKIRSVIFPDVGLGHVDAVTWSSERQRVRDSRRVSNVPFWCFRPEHELILPRCLF